MTSSSAEPPLPDRMSDAFSKEALASERQSLRVRIVALVLIGLVVLVVTPWPYSLYYHALLPLFALTGYLNYRLRQRHWPDLWPSYVMVALDVMLLTLVLLLPNPTFPEGSLWPIQMQLRFGNFVYFYVFMVALAFTYSPRLVIWGACVAATSWSTGVALIYFRPDTLRPGPDDRSEAILAAMLDPYFVDRGVAFQEVVLFLIIAAALATFVWRTRRVAQREAWSERQRAGLARYFSPTVVASLADTTEPFRQGRTQRAAVLFADIVGFTGHAEMLSPEETLELLRAYHGRMAAAVFTHGGTLDKFIGDGLMATFGTPDPSEQDAADAVACARAILDTVGDWNGEREEAGLKPVRVGVGVHAGPVVMGNIGDARRLEFAVIGDTVNVASRLERLTRTLETDLVLSAAAVDLVRQQRAPEAAEKLLEGIVAAPDQAIRGRDGTIAVHARRGDGAPSSPS